MPLRIIRVMLMMVNLQDKMISIHQRCTEKTWKHYETISTSFGARNTGLHQLQYSNSLNETVDIYTKRREGKIKTLAENRSYII